MSVVVPKIRGLKATFECPATVFLPGDGGEYVAHKFTVHFKRQTTEQRDELSKRYITGEINTAQLLNDVVDSWEGWLDDDGKPVPYSQPVRAATEELYAGTEQAMAVSWFDHAFINQRQAAEKKLQGAVRHWYGLDGADDDVVDADVRLDCDVLGLDVDQLIDPVEQQTVPTDYELWPEHAKAWALYQACETQWRLVLGMGGAVWLGLDMPGVDVIRKAHRIDDEAWTDVLWQLQVMEAEGKTIRNARLSDG